MIALLQVTLAGALLTKLENISRLKKETGKKEGVKRCNAYFLACLVEGLLSLLVQRQNS